MRKEDLDGHSFCFFFPACSRLPRLDDGGRWCWLTCSRWRHGGDGVCGAQQLVCILWSVSKAIVCVLAQRWEHMYMSALLSLFGSESRRVS